MSKHSKENLTRVKKLEADYYEKFLEKAIEFQNGTVHGTSFKQYVSGQLAINGEKKFRLHEEMFEYKKAEDMENKIALPPAAKRIEKQ